MSTVLFSLQQVFGLLVLAAAPTSCASPTAQDDAVAADEDPLHALAKEITELIEAAPVVLELAGPRPEELPVRALVLPELRASNDGLLDTQFTIDYGLNRVWNAKQKQPVTVHLRSYERSLVGPTLKVRPGDTLRVEMINELPPNKRHTGGINEPHQFNTTNLHTHGLHVSPSGNSDNVLVSIEPGQEFENEVHIPADHPPGTFWYHGHVHGSTSIQVSSGMAGALIVEGGLDHVPEIREAQDQIFVLQQMPYLPIEGTDYYGIERYEDFEPGKWPEGVNENGWRTTINGQTYPAVHFYPGEMQRWRFIHSGVREEVDLCLLKYSDAKALLEAGVTEEGPYHSSAVPLYEIAADGLAYGFKWKRKHVDLYPGYRSDLLVLMNEPGIYVLLDLQALVEKSLHQAEETTKLLAVVQVDGRRGQGRKMSLPEDDDLEHLRPHRSITDEEVTEQRPDGNSELRVQRLKFQIVGGNSDLGEPTLFIAGDPEDPEHFRPFGENGVRELQLGKADEWHLTAEIANHPFHIHVNPFEILEHPWFTDDEQPRDEAGNPRTIWKDTIIVPDRKGTVRVRSRYERYIGRFVLHCHILDHEDQGMMQLVEIVGPGMNSLHDGGH